MNIPSKCQELVTALTIGGWSFVLNHGHDTGNNPFISIEGRRASDESRGSDHLMVTWHTRATGTYRLFSCMVNKRDTTLTKAMETVA